MDRFLKRLPKKTPPAVPGRQVNKDDSVPTSRGNTDKISVPQDPLSEKSSEPTPGSSWMSPVPGKSSDPDEPYYCQENIVIEEIVEETAFVAPEETIEEESSDHSYTKNALSRVGERTDEGEQNEDEGEQNEDEGPPSKKPLLKQKKGRKNTFSKKWLEVPDFKPWLSQSADSKKGNDLAFCSLCVTNITAHKSDIIRHSKSSKHLDNMKTISKNKKISQVMSDLPNQVKRAEVKIAGLLAAKNLPLSLMDEFGGLFPDIFPDSNIAKNLKQHRTKATAVMKHAISKNFDLELSKKLAENFFSIIIDETTDCSSKKQCAMVVIYYDDDDKTVQVRLLDMVEVSSTTAEDLLKVIKTSLSNRNIPYSNIIGFSADTTNVMFGEHLSVSALMKQELPHAAFIKCSCHMLHLAASKASLKLPLAIEDLLRNLGAHFSRSFSRQEKLKEFQEYFGVDIHKILLPSNTRWLSAKDCVDRLLEQYTAVTEYLRLAVFEDPSRTTEQMLMTLSDKFTRAYLEFMSYALGLFTSLNMLFQRETPSLHKVKPMVDDLLSVLYMNVGDPEKLRGLNIPEMEFSEEHYGPLDRVYVGLAADDSIKDLKKHPDVSEEEVLNFYKICRDFYLEAARQIKSRFDFSDTLYTIIKVVEPKVSQTFTFKSLEPVLKRFPQVAEHVNRQELDQEWRIYSYLKFSEFGLDSSRPTDEYWRKVFFLVNDAGMPRFPNLEKVFKCLMVLPFSNAAVERVFSDLRNCKTFHRNKLKAETLSALLRTKEGIEKKGGIVKFQPSKQMINSKWWK